MARKKPMGDVTFGGTAADAVAAANEDAPAPKSRAKPLKVEKVMYRLEPKQIAELRAEARRRADVKGKAEGRATIRDDASEVLREILDEWISKRRKS